MNEQEGTATKDIRDQIAHHERVLKLFLRHRDRFIDEGRGTNALDQAIAREESEKAWWEGLATLFADEQAS